MKKIISLYQRNHETDRLVRDEVTPGAEWVLAGEGIATVKFDGTAVLIRDGKPYIRYDAKAGRTPPPNWEPVQPEPDPVTSHWPGWLPADRDAPAHRWLWEAWDRSIVPFATYYLSEPWTYELVGPKVQGNPYGLEHHSLWPHGSLRPEDDPRTFEEIRDYFDNRSTEGIVWWRDINDLDCDKVKIKAKDFGVTWQARKSA